MTPRVALTIAGSDSGGGAGLQADLKAFAAHGVFGTSAVTAVTAQNTTAVLGVVAMDPSFVVAQIDAVLTDLSVAAVKTGMLATPRPLRRSPRSHGTGPSPTWWSTRCSCHRPAIRCSAKAGWRPISSVSSPVPPCSRPTFAKRPCSAGSMSHP